MRSGRDSPINLLDPPPASLPGTKLTDTVNHSLRSLLTLIHEPHPLFIYRASLSLMPRHLMLQALLILTSCTFHVVPILVIELTEITIGSLAQSASCCCHFNPPVVTHQTPGEIRILGQRVQSDLPVVFLLRFFRSSTSNVLVVQFFSTLGAV